MKYWLAWAWVDAAALSLKGSLVVAESSLDHSLKPARLMGRLNYFPCCWVL